MKNIIYVILITILAAAGLFACKKDKNKTVNTSSSTEIVMATPTVAGNIATISWSKLNNDSLVSYMLVRVTDTTVSTSQSTMYKILDKSVTQITDTLPLTPYAQYYVMAQLPATSYPRSITSNKVKYSRTDISFMSIIPKDVLYDRSSRQLYIYSASGDIAIYDVAGKSIVKQIATTANIGFCDIGTYNGRKELYVPRTDGWLFIYDAQTLDQIDQINVGTQLFCVVYANGILFVSNYSSSSDNIVSYNRADKKLVSKTYGSSASRLKLIPGSNLEFLTINYSSQITRYIFDNRGTYVSQQSGYPANTALSAEIFEMYADGSHFITSAAGTIVNKSLAYVSTLPHGNIAFTSFDFDNTNNLIYAGCSTKAIKTYAMDNYQLTKTINTMGYPVKVFYDNGEIISVSSNSGNPYSGSSSQLYTFIERF